MNHADPLSSVSKIRIAAVATHRAVVPVCGSHSYLGTYQAPGPSAVPAPGGVSLFHALGRTGAPCPRCGTPIRRIILAGRSSHFCPRCQRRR
ncbi:zinc finger domain-containing protein [Leucobacter sp. W1478]|uniref:zinc finger domain-containing protein n=1 Tax=Leucobacter sp. W1478 TaxID=3439065 RepID=UPI003F30BC5F